MFLSVRCHPDAIYSNVTLLQEHSFGHLVNKYLFMPEPGPVRCWGFEANWVVCPVLKEAGGEERKQTCDHSTAWYSMQGTGLYRVWRKGCFIQAGEDGEGRAQQKLPGGGRGFWRRITSQLAGFSSLIKDLNFKYSGTHWNCLQTLLCVLCICPSVLTGHTAFIGCSEA